MVPGQLTASWTRRAEAFCINFTLKMPYQSRNSTSEGKLERLLFPVVCWMTLSPTSSSGFIMRWRQLAHTEMDRFSFWFWDASKSLSQWSRQRETRLELLMPILLLLLCDVSNDGTWLPLCVFITGWLYRSLMLIIVAAPVAHSLIFFFNHLCVCVREQMSKHKAAEIASTCVLEAPFSGECLDQVSPASCQVACGGYFRTAFGGMRAVWPLGAMLGSHLL